MKKILFLLAAALSWAAVSCSKETSGGEEVLPEGTYLAELKAGISSAIAAKTTIDPQTLGIDWASGDAIKLYQDYDDGGIRNKLNYVDDGGYFAGTVSLKGGDAAVYLMTPDYRVTAKTGKCDLSVNASHNQSGLLSEISKALMLYNSSAIIPEYDGSRVILNGIIDKCLNPIIKVDVPEALAVTQITLSAVDAQDSAVPVSGVFTFRQSENSILTDGDRTEIYIRRDGAKFSGDVYISMINAPAFIGPDNNTGRAAKIKLTVQTASSKKFTFAKAVSSLEGGKVYAFGTLPVACVNPVITADDDGRVTIRTSPSEAKIYYTTDGSEPTSSSAQYEAPFLVNGSCTVKAIAVCSGLETSAVSSKEVSVVSVSAPVVSLNAEGKLVASCETEGVVLYYSYSTSEMPGDPDTVLPAEGADLANGTFYIRVRASKGSKYADTNAFLRHYHIVSTENSKTIAAGATVPLGNGDFTVYNPTDEEVNLHCAGHTKWGISDTYYPGSLSLRFGCVTKYSAYGSLYILVEVKKGIDFHYGDTTVVLKNTVTTNNEYANAYSLDVIPGIPVSFNFNVNSVNFIGCAWLEQGFDTSVIDAGASVGNEGFDGTTPFIY